MVRQDKRVREVPVDQAFKIGHEHLCANRIEQAQDIFRKIIKSVPRHAGALHFLGVTYFRQGKVEQAVPLLRQGLEILPSDAGMHFNLAGMLAQQEKWDQALASARQAAELSPQMAELKPLLARCLFHNGCYAEAMPLLQQLTSQGQVKANVWQMLGKCYMELADFAPACDAYEKAAELKSDSPSIWNNLGWARGSAYRVAASAEAFSKALELCPQAAQFHLNYALSLVDLGRVDEAMQRLDRAIELEPDNGTIHTCRAYHNLLVGRMAEAWDEYEWRWRMEGSKFPELAGPVWDGCDVRGKRVLVLWEQGFGDVLQFARYVNLLADRGAYVILVCQQALGRLMTTLPGVRHVVEHRGQLPQYDYWLPLMSLPRIFRTTMESIPANVPYLWPLKQDAEQWAGRLAGDGRFRVGLVWSTVSGAKTWRRKSIPAADVLDLLETPEVSFYGMHVGARREELEMFGPRVIDLSPELKDFAATAAAMSQMDLVISIDSAAAHLAGALGRPLWVLLPWLADWRWLMDRSDSPWYPTVRLFRQKTPGQWSGALAEVKQELAGLAERHQQR